MPRTSQWQWWVAAPLIVLWAGMMLFGAYGSLEAWRARSAIRKMLDAPDGEFAVLVDGRPAPQSDAVLRAIRGVHWRMAHHTHPEKEIEVTIRRDQAELDLTLGRDSGLPQEYWVFWTREKSNANRLQIGRIDTPVFDSQ
jgi:hypothetical protein